VNVSFRVASGGLLGPWRRARTTGFYSLRADRADTGFSLGWRDDHDLPMIAAPGSALAICAGSQSIFRCLTVEQNIRAIL